ncbi:Retinal dehydrogenase 1 [Cyphellophora attinorum]|uniref:aldehyde dehydrogenase (NAD(+)) n=1 Tax=Cyphellophora attinorum TaxID=1664694 RepID=A0A0N1GY88_9EURO|nr:Retinal dehydrogenase 1 [Phialophora attinorum]KPI35622.1 Retinal dehydrogenase 1 [Phialophora attinorum]
MSKYETRLWIDGQYQPVNGSTYSLSNPATGKWLADIPSASAEDVEKAVKAAQKAQPAWAATPAYMRARVLRKFSDLIHENRLRLQELDSICMGKPMAQAADDVEEGRNILNFFSGLVELTHGETSLNTADHLNMMVRQPFGVVAAIVPWNFPTMLACHEIGPSTGAGNAVILKTSEKSPLSGSFLGKLSAEAGFPPGIVNIISGAGDTGALLSSHMQIRKISFTGSTNAGRAVMQAAAKSNLKDVALELGGKSPLLVFADANLEQAAARAIASITTNAGQICTASSRAYVEKSIAEDFRKRLSDGFKSIVQGDPSAEGTGIGPQADSKQAQNILRYFEIAKQDGKLLIFGPVLVVHEFETEEDAVKRANETEYGLYASVFTRDINKAMRVARALEAGSVGVNTASPYGAYELPFGGFKASGIGRQKGSASLLAWTQEKSIFVNHGDS